MKPIRRWDQAECPECGAAAYRPCDYTPPLPYVKRKVHVARQLRSLQLWWAEADRQWMTVPCPVQTCGAEVGRRCEPNRYQQGRLYFAHDARKQLVDGVIEEGVEVNE